MKHLIIGVGLASAIVSPALSGGLAVPTAEPPVVVADAPVFDWTGFYAGFGVTEGDAAAATFATDSGGYGLQIGYLHALGTMVVGGELAYSRADLDDLPGDITATRLKVIGGYAAGRFLPYAFVGLSDIEIAGAGLSFTDTVTNYGIGARYALGA